MLEKIESAEVLTVHSHSPKTLKEIIFLHSCSWIKMYIRCINLLQEMINTTGVIIKAMWEVIDLQSVSRFQFPFNPNSRLQFPWHAIGLFEVPILWLLNFITPHNQHIKHRDTAIILCTTSPSLSQTWLFWPSLLFIFNSHFTALYCFIKLWQYSFCLRGLKWTFSSQKHYLASGCVGNLVRVLLSPKVQAHALIPNTVA